MSIQNSYKKAVDFVEAFSNSSMRKNIRINNKDPIFFIDRTRYFLSLLKDPEKDLSFIHVTGTAGKGTVSTMLQEILVASGKKTGLFTSPYTTTALEKIRVDDMYISPAEFVRLVDYIKPYIAKSQNGPYGAPSSFELFFAIALLYFKRQKCQWVVLEVGLGGRYDATNIIESPKITAITNIDYDHTEILGKTLREIATDKSGIIKPGSAFFTSEQRPTIQRLFRKICQKKNVSFHAVCRQENYSGYNRKLVEQIALYLGISYEHIEQGIENTRLPCRFESVEETPRVILDGAHNRAKIRSTISNLKCCTFNKLYLIIAIADNKKDNRAILRPILLLPYKKHVVFTQIKIKDRKTLAPSILMDFGKRYVRKGDTVEVIENASNALDRILGFAGKDDMVLITGSFFLAGELRKRWVSEDWILHNRKSFKP